MASYRTLKYFFFFPLLCKYPINITTGTRYGQFEIFRITCLNADPIGHEVQGEGLRLLACWDCGYESHRGNLSALSVVCCQVKVSAANWSLVQRSHPVCGALLCVIQKPQDWGGHGPGWAAAPQGENNFWTHSIDFPHHTHHLDLLNYLDI